MSILFFKHSTPQHPQKTRGAKTNGFSLVEVIIAVGIVATVMLGLVGVMPVGLQSIQDAQHNSVKARILQEVISDLQAADWASAASGDKRIDPNTLKLQEDLLGERNTRYYNAQGARISPQAGRSSASEAPPTIIYAALIEIAPGNGDNPLLMTGDRNNAYRFLKLVNIYVENTPGGRAPEFKNPKRSKFIDKFPFVLANMGNSASVRNE